jgi:hypothetical protein
MNRKRKEACFIHSNLTTLFPSFRFFASRKTMGHLNQWVAKCVMGHNGEKKLSLFFSSSSLFLEIQQLFFG